MNFKVFGICKFAEQNVVADYNIPIRMILGSLVCVFSFFSCLRAASQTVDWQSDTRFIAGRDVSTYRNEDLSYERYGQNRLSNSNIQF